MKTNPIDYNQGDCRLLRVICLLGAIIAPIIKIAWSYSISATELNIYDSNIRCLIYSGTLLLLFLFTYLFSLVKKYAYYIVYGLFMLSTVGFIYEVRDNKFSVQSVLLLFLITASLNMIVKKMIHLIYYDICTLVSLLIALFTVEQNNVPRVYLIFFFLLYYGFNLGFVGLKLRTQNALAKSEQDYRKLVEITPQAIIVAQNGKIILCNAAAVTLSGANSPSDLRNQKTTRFLNCEKSLPDWNKTAYGEKEPEFQEEKFIRVDGVEVDVETSVVYAMIGEKPATVYIIKDISERKNTEKKIRQLAYFDTLTGLPNRYHLINSLEEIITKSSITKQNSAVLFMDLDGFKKVNDTLGHYSGDILLQQVADRLMKCVRNGDIISRYGGDEFVILSNGANRSNGYTVAQRILNAFSLPFYVDNHEMYITPSIGISLYPEDGTDVTTLIKNADLAMYQAKEKGKNKFQYYSAEFDERRKEQLRDKL